jgi:hypothetical protein
MRINACSAMNRRVMWRKRKLRDKAASNFLHVSGPNAVGVPRVGHLDMKQHLEALTPAEIQQAHQRLEKRLALKEEKESDDSFNARGLPTGLCRPIELG